MPVGALADPGGVYAQILALMGTQHGLIRRRQALDAGLSGTDVDALVRTGTWVALRRGVYMESGAWAALERWREQPLQQARAASLNMCTPHVLSHDSAAYALGLPILQATPLLTHITRPGVLGSRNRHGVKHHKAPYDADSVVTADGLPALPLARTALDIAREHGFASGLVAVDGARRLGVTLEQLRHELHRMRSWAGVTQVRRAVELSDPGAANPFESLLRALLIELHLGPVETQFGLHRDGRTVWCDARIGRQIVEGDGRLKYLTPEQGGIARDPRQAVWEEKRRQDFISSFRLGVSRVVWADLQPDTWEATKQRLRSDILATAATYGTDVEDLAPFIVRRPPTAA